MKKAHKLTLLSLILAIGWLGFLWQSASAATNSTFVITKATDTNDGVCDSDCSLREAVMAANVNVGADVIDFSADATSFYTLPLGTLLIDSNITFNCGLPFLTETLSGIDSTRTLSVTANADLTLNSCNLNNGFASDGGALYNRGTVTLNDGNISFNDALDDGGAIFNSGTLTINRVFFSSNMANGGGGAIYSIGTLAINESELTLNESFNHGGAVETTGDLTIERTSIDQNTTTGLGGGIYNNGGTTIITQSSVTSNRAREDATFNGRGGGIYSTGLLNIENSTISSNLAAHSSLTGGDGGGLFVAGGSAEITHVTMGHNWSPDLGANVYVASGANFTSTNSIIATTDLVIGINCTIEAGGSLTTQGANLADDSTCTGFTEGDPNLSMLFHHGDPLTYSHLLQDPSDALDMADAAFCPDRDQRNYARPAGAACDLGATEQDSMPLAVQVRGISAETDSSSPALLLLSLLLLILASTRSALKRTSSS